jgi:hypothetical protein
VTSTQTTAETLPATTTTTLPTTTTAPVTTLATTSTAPSTTLDTTPREFPSESCCGGRPIGAGLYATPSWFNIPKSMRVDDGWKVMNEREALLLAIVRGQTIPAELPSELIVFLDASSAESVDVLMQQFREEPAITQVGEPTEATLAAFEGMQQDFSVLPNPENKGNPASDIPPGVRYIPVMGQFFTPGFSWISSSPEARLRVFGVDTGDSLLLVRLEAPPNDFENLVAGADRILQTLTPFEP